MPEVSSEMYRALDRIVTLERQMAVREEMMKGVELRLSKIETILSRLTWIVVTGIGGALVAFVISGGLSPAIKAVAG